MTEETDVFSSYISFLMYRIHKKSHCVLKEVKKNTKKHKMYETYYTKKERTG